MALSMQAMGCSSSFTNGATLIGVRGSPSLCRRARNLPPRSSLSQQEGEDECSNVDYEDVASKWLSADFLDLRLRSSGLICNEAVQSLRKHFQKEDEQPAATAATVMSTTVIQQVVQEQAESSASQVKTRPLANVIVFDEALFSQLYNSSSTYTSKCSFLDESFC